MTRILFLIMGKFLLAILLVALFSASAYAEGEPFITKKEKADLDKVVRNLEAAIKKRDFTALHIDIPMDKTPLYWRQCNGESEEVSFNELASRLKGEASGKGRIYVNPIADSGEMAVSINVETRGWNEERPYINFRFSTTFNRLYGATYCDEPIYPFSNRNSRGDIRIDSSQKNIPAITDLRLAVEDGDYEPIRQYVPSGKIYTWGACGYTDVVPGEYSFDEMNKKLLELGQGADIKVLAGPELGGPYGDSAASAAIETGEWKGDHPYIGFVFELIVPENVWAWTRVYDCSFAPGKRPWGKF